MGEKFVVTETEHGIEIAVEGLETADEFDDFLAEERDVSTYLRSISDGMIFGLGKQCTHDQATALLQAFLDKRAR